MYGGSFTFLSQEIVRYVGRNVSYTLVESSFTLTFLFFLYGNHFDSGKKMLYVSGQPLGLPHLAQPTQADIDLWHKKYCDDVTRLFNTYKERLPDYKHKTLEIV